MLDTYETMNGTDRILRAKVQLQDKQPFFSYLMMNMRIIRDDAVETMCVDNCDRIIFNEQFTRSLTEGELTGVLCHEVMHRVLNHIARIWSLDSPMIGNIAADIKVNQMLLKNQFQLPSGVLIPNIYDNAIRVEVGDQSVLITDIDSLAMENIYEKIISEVKDTGKQGGGQDIVLSDGTKMSGAEGGFDKHAKAPPSEVAKQGPDASGEDNPNELSEKWKDILCQAATIAKQRGVIPAGMEGLIGELLAPKIPWRQKLYRFMTNDIFHNFCWSRPHKKSMCVGVYLPVVTKESIEMVTHVDTSGSISTEEMCSFMTEIYSILNAFTNINMTLLMCDCEIKGEPIQLDAQNKVDIVNGTLKRRGYGGTSHKPVVDWINKNKSNCRLFISLTDGYSDIEHCYSELPSSTTRIILLPKEYAGMTKKLDAFGDVVVIDD